MRPQTKNVYEGPPCRKCGSTTRYCNLTATRKKTGGCVKCQRAYATAYNATPEGKETLKRSKKKYLETHPPTDEQREKWREHNRKKGQKNAAKYNAAQRARYAAKKAGRELL